MEDVNLSIYPAVPRVTSKDVWGQIMTNGSKISIVSTPIDIVPFFRSKRQTLLHHRTLVGESVKSLFARVQHRLFSNPSECDIVIISGIDTLRNWTDAKKNKFWKSIVNCIIRLKIDKLLSKIILCLSDSASDCFISFGHDPVPVCELWRLPLEKYTLHSFPYFSICESVKERVPTCNIVQYDDYTFRLATDYDCLSREHLIVIIIMASLPNMYKKDKSLFTRKVHLTGARKSICKEKHRRMRQVYHQKLKYKGRTLSLILLCNFLILHFSS